MHKLYILRLKKEERTNCTSSFYSLFLCGGISLISYSRQAQGHPYEGSAALLTKAMAYPFENGQNHNACLGT